MIWKLINFLINQIIYVIIIFNKICVLVLCKPGKNNFFKIHTVYICNIAQYLFTVQECDATAAT